MRLQCLAHGTPPLSFQWSRADGTLPGSVASRNELLHFEPAGPEDSGRYRCQVANRVGSAEAFAQVLVQGKQQGSGSAGRGQPASGHLGYKGLPPCPQHHALLSPGLQGPGRLPAPESPITVLSAPPGLGTTSLHWHPQHWPGSSVSHRYPAGPCQAPGTQGRTCTRSSQMPWVCPPQGQGGLGTRLTGTRVNEWQPSPAHRTQYSMATSKPGEGFWA